MSKVYQPYEVDLQREVVTQDYTYEGNREVAVDFDSNCGSGLPIFQLGDPDLVQDVVL